MIKIEHLSNFQKNRDVKNQYKAFRNQIKEQDADEEDDLQAFNKESNPEITQDNSSVDRNK